MFNVQVPDTTPEITFPDIDSPIKSISKYWPVVSESSWIINFAKCIPSILGLYVIGKAISVFGLTVKTGSSIINWLTDSLSSPSIFT